MDAARKKALIENYCYTWDEGVPCVVGGGWENPWASVSPSTGWSYGITWIDLERIAGGDHDIPKSACWLHSSQWLGCMTDDEAKQKRAEWRLAQEAGRFCAMEHTPTLTELAENDPELKNYLVTQGGRFLAGLEHTDLFLDESESPNCLVCDNPNDGTIAIRRENTAYCDDVNNWLISCRRCFDWRDERWAEQWADYYSMVL